jgi:hypothetical protein
MKKNINLERRENMRESMDFWTYYSIAAADSGVLKVF